jgi:hypothetical protein
MDSNVFPTRNSLNAIPAPSLDAAQKMGILQAVAQLEMLSQIFPSAPERVRIAHKEFVTSLKEWASA